MDRPAPLRAPLLNRQGRVIGHLAIGLPGGNRPDVGAPPLLDESANPQREGSLEPLQLIEAMEYTYELELEPPLTARLTLDPEELFSPDPDGQRGRLRTGQSTGLLVITLRAGTEELAQCRLEVRSRKLNYTGQYRWMLRDVAEAMSELVMERFAPTQQRFVQDDRRDSVTRYQQFMLLKSLMFGDRFEMAVQQIIARPHRAWVQEWEERRPDQGAPATAAVLRELGRPGPRVTWAGNHALTSLPRQIRISRTEESLDTPENRFVRFVLMGWRDFAADLEQALLAEPVSAPVRRGLREVQAVVERLNELLSAELFDEVGPLRQFPIGSQVLQKREGYRDLLQAYIQFETAALLTWEGGEDVYAAGKRDVATLYEYWVFLQLMKVVGQFCRRDFDPASLLVFHKNGMGVALKRGRSRAVGGTLERLGRKLRVDLFFNATFSPRGRRSWTRLMRPDCSLRIQPAGDYMTEPVWLHFDAKYRVERLAELFGENPQTRDEERALIEAEVEAESAATPPEEHRTAKREDLLKMHAYRDAIKRTAGAYVIYPGTEEAMLPEYHELLPGLGAFPLRPTESGVETGAEALRGFIEDVLLHVASQVTQHERARYWVEQATAGEPPRDPNVQAAPFLTRPPADTLVLVAPVGSAELWEWVREQGRYPLPAGSALDLTARELAVEFILLCERGGERVELWRVEGKPEVWTPVALAATRFPGAGVHFCLAVVPVQGSVLSWKNSTGKLLDAPEVMAWQELKPFLR